MYKYVLSISTLGVIGCTDPSLTHGRLDPTLERGRTTIVTTNLSIAGGGLGVNVSGEVVGGAGGRAFHWRDGVLTTLGGSTPRSYAHVVSDSGLIGGTLENADFTEAAAIWGADRTTPFVVDPVPIEISYVRRLNSAGQAAVRHWNGNFTSVRDMFWSAATGTVDIGHLGAERRSIYDLDESGAVVGHSGIVGADLPDHAFVWRLGSGMVDLGTLGGRWSVARAISDRGEIVGYAATADGTLHPVKWVDGVIQQLDVARGEANDVNNSGHVVGARVIDGRNHATLWRDGVAIDLGAGPGSEAFRINDVDVVVGRSASGPFVWTNPAEGPIALPTLGGAGPSSIDYFNGTFMAGNFVVGSTSTDAGFTAVRWEIQVTPLSEDGPIGDLENSVDDLEDAGVLGEGEANALDAKLDGALMQCQRGNENAAQSQLEAFIRHVQALLRSGRITVASGQALIDEAEAILANLECP